MAVGQIIVNDYTWTNVLETEEAAATRQGLGGSFIHSIVSAMIHVFRIHSLDDAKPTFWRLQDRPTSANRQWLGSH